MCDDAGTICLHIWKDLQLDMNWRRRLNATNQLATLHTGELALMTDYEDNSRPVWTLYGTHTHRKQVLINRLEPAVCTLCAQID